MTEVNKGKWEHVNGQFSTERAWGTCSNCGKQSELQVEPYYLSVDVIGLDNCPHCKIPMEYYFHNFEYRG